MLGEIERRPLTVVDQCGDLVLSVFSIMRCPRRHGQSNTTHFGRLRLPTKTAPFRGRCWGTLSAESTTPTMRQPKIGIHSHHEIVAMSAMFALRTARSFRSRACGRPDGNNGPPVGMQDWSKSRVRDSAIRLRSDARRVHNLSSVPEVR